MDIEKKKKAMLALRVQANYINWERGLQPSSLLKEIAEPDQDFEKAFEKIKISKGEILDIGCGWGYLSIHVANMGHTVLGIDLSLRAIQYAKEKALNRKINCHFLVCNILEAEFKQTFDVIMDRGCLALMSKNDADQYMEKVFTLTKPNGYFLLKIDIGKKMARLKNLEKYNFFFKTTDEWEGNYIRSDEKIIKTMFFIGQKKST